MATGAPQSPGNTVASEWREGWPGVLGATLAIGSGSALYGYVAGTFVAPLQQATGWTRTEIAAVALAGLLGALAAPAIGALCGRWGARRVGLMGLVLTGLTYMALAAAPAALPIYYGAHIALAVLGPASTALTFTPPLVARFQRSRGLALAVSLSGPALTAAIVAPLLIVLTSMEGWRAGYLLLAAVCLCVGVPASRLLSPHIRAAVRSDADEGASWAEALRQRAFWLLALATLLACLPLGGFLGQLQPLLGDRGIGKTDLAAVASLAALSVVVGRVTVGILLDRLPSSYVAAGAMALAALGAALLANAASDLRFIMAAALLVGAAQGAESDLVAYITARTFGLRAYSAIFSAFLAIITLAIPLGGVLFAATYDATGSYDPALWVAALSFLAAGACFIGAGVPRPR